ncbi:hypothetical protein [Rummeliibacillus suwonensis]|uniref:hypothetical protein n=1 Tax=Rummeliibacillus suwonensis TaxID=1306154 RepID=UPI001646537E|nr:hypothetical protein [Rummeliibacillus suwonensis]
MSRFSLGQQDIGHRVVATGHGLRLRSFNCSLQGRIWSLTSRVALVPLQSIYTT